MIILVIGTSNSGKSEYAESLLLELAGANPKLYIATMIPYGREGEERVKKHRALRAGKGFETIECADNILSLRERLQNMESPNCLLECMSNLVGNEMHLPSNKDLSDEELVNYIVESVKGLANLASNTVIVANEYEVQESYDEETIRYIKLTHEVNEMLRSIADRVDDEFLTNMETKSK